jgi:hypothetical protein
MVTLDFGSFTQAEKTALLAAAKAEVLRRASGGAISSGSSANQNFTMQKMSDDALFNLINSLSLDLGYAQPENRVMPNFAYSPSGGFNYGCR